MNCRLTVTRFDVGRLRSERSIAECRDDQCIPYPRLHPPISDLFGELIETNSWQWGASFGISGTQACIRPPAKPSLITNGADRSFPLLLCLTKTRPAL
jgi:hypothetical protein